ncbi:MAG: glutathione S-transferase family protein [Spirochaetota bacterium]
MKLKVYGDILSGNCYKIKLLLEFLGLSYEWVPTNVLRAETHTDEFVAMNPNAKIPVLLIDDSKYLWESNAILNYLAEGSPFLPTEKYSKALVLQWQFFEQYSHEPYIAVARYLKLFLGLPAERVSEYEGKHEGGYKALAVMENHLKKSKFFVGEQLTIADISLYAYTHVADEGGFSLDAYPNVIRWLKDFAASKNYVPMRTS